LNEHSFVKAIHRLLPKEIYKWKIHDKFTGGVPDAYYEGSKGSLWIEYKYVKTLPKREGTEVQLGLSALQQGWLARAVENKINAWVVVGNDNKCLVLQNKRWTYPFNNDYYRLYSVTNKELVALISSNTLHQQREPNESTYQTNSRRP